MKPEEVCVYTVLYGPHHDLHKRLLESLWRMLPLETPVEMFLNTVPEETHKFVIDRVRPSLDRLRRTDNHAKKYPLMREMFQDLKDGMYPEVKWIVWFDDDAHITAKHGWWEQTTDWISVREKDDICYAGQCWFIHWKAGQQDFISKSPWQTGAPWALVGNKKKQPGIEFAQGSYWWLRRDIMQMLDWPDPRIIHNGGDTMLAEAIRQQGLKFHKMPWDCFGVKLNDAKRRGYHEAPAGCTNKNARA